ncbi:MAG: uracil-DNA glycosylase [Clostridia bacterium]|nr:uracil-DNA glycosylase [Clostridia bacterium]
MDLETLREKALSCQGCPLRRHARQVVFGEGNPRADLMLVGEGPGAQEDEAGRPFVGPAGQLLDRILAAAGLQRAELYITNIVKCRPPGNRQPLPAEVQACRPILEAQIKLIQPRIIVCLGAVAMRALIAPGASITRLRGQWITRDGIRYLLTFHPAALLRDASKKRPVWEDFKSLRQVYRSEQVEQLSMEFPDKYLGGVNRGSAGLTRLGPR